MEGFLPPDVTAPQGEGFVTYTVQAKTADDADGDSFSAQASVVFDTNSPLATPQYTNTVDSAPPTSTVLVSPVQTSDTFTVNWIGSDGAGSGIADYSVFVSTNGGAFQPLVTDTTETSTSFTGVAGDTYGFYSVAADNVGNVQATPTAAQTTTLVAAPNRFVSLSAKTPAKYTDANGDLVTITLSGPGSGQLGFFGTANSDPLTFTLSGTTAKSRITIHTRKGVTTLNNVAVTGALAAFTAGTTDLDGIFTISGTLGSLNLAGVAGSYSTVTITGTSVPTMFSLGTVTDLTLTTSSAIKNLTAASWTGVDGFTGAISAPSMAAAHIRQSFTPNVTLSGGGSAIGSFTSGPIVGGTWTITGNARTITTGAISAGVAMNFSGAVTSLTIHGSDGGSITAASAKTVIVTGAVAAGVAMNFSGAMSSLTIHGSDGGSITAASIKTMTVTGALTDATLDLTGTSVSTKSPDLRTLTIQGSVTDSQIIAAGTISTITAGGMSGSDVFAGVAAGQTTLPTVAADFTADAAITKITLSGHSPFSDSLIAASSIGTAALHDVNAENGGIPFGVAAESLHQISIYQPHKAAFVWNNKKKVSQLATLPDDLRVTLV